MVRVKTGTKGEGEKKRPPVGIAKELKKLLADLKQKKRKAKDENNETRASTRRWVDGPMNLLGTPSSTPSYFIELRPPLARLVIIDDWPH